MAGKIQTFSNINVADEQGEGSYAGGGVGVVAMEEPKDTRLGKKRGASRRKGIPHRAPLQ
ncbi:hypothetical protein Ancab_027772 [Ancistrocladus abbreviatus]